MSELFNREYFFDINEKGTDLGFFLMNLPKTKKKT